MLGMSVMTQNVPDLRKYWCRNCRGHHRTYNRGSGDGKTTMCKNCDSDDLHRVTPITLWQKFGYSLFILVPLSLGVVAQILSNKFSFTPAMAYVFYGMAVLCAFGFGYVYRTKSAVRNEWLIWAKERGYEENAKKSEGQKSRNPLKKELKKPRSLKNVLGQ